MRRLTVILCLLANLSVLLMPFATAHAHLDAPATATVEFHAGHGHDFHHERDAGGSSGEVVDLTDTLTSQPKPDLTFWSDWLPLACMILLVVGLAPLSSLLLIPRRSDPKPPSRSGYWRPPLRGPPAFSIP